MGFVGEIMKWLGKRFYRPAGKHLADWFTSWKQKNKKKNQRAKGPRGFRLISLLLPQSEPVLVKGIASHCAVICKELRLCLYFSFQTQILATKNLCWKQIHHCYTCQVEKRWHCFGTFFTFHELEMTWKVVCTLSFQQRKVQQESRVVTWLYYRNVDAYVRLTWVVWEPGRQLAGSSRKETESCASGCGCGGGDGVKMSRAWGGRQQVALVPRGQRRGSWRHSQRLM